MCTYNIDFYRQSTIIIIIIIIIIVVAAVVAVVVVILHDLQLETLHLLCQICCNVLCSQMKHQLDATL